MSILVVGSVAFDSIKTPFGEASEILGGSATYFSVSASYFAQVNLVAVVGEDFSDKHVEVLSSRGVDIRGLEKAKGKTFRWAGEYDYNLNTRKTLETQLNVFADFKPKIVREYQYSDIVFLGNIDPDLQREVLRQAKKPKLVACDTMNYWIEGKLQSLIQTLALVDILLVDESETRQLTREHNLVKAAKKILALGPKVVVVKRGEYGVLMFHKKFSFSAPAYPLEEVFDPTGAGDSFAGGFLGYLASMSRLGNIDTEEENLKKAIIFGSAMGSFCVEEFGLQRLVNLSYPQITARYNEFKRLTHFEELDVVRKSHSLEV